MLEYNGQRYFEIRGLRVWECFNIKKISFKKKFVCYKSDIVSEIYRRDDYAIYALNRAFGIICPIAINYWKRWCVTFELLDVPMLNIRYGFASLSIKNNGRVLQIRYKKTEALILFHLLYILNLNEPNIDIFCGDIKIDMWDDINAFIRIMNETSVTLKTQYTPLIKFNERHIFDELPGI